MVGLPDEDGPTMSSDELKAAVRAETEASPPEDEDAEDGPTVQATVSPEIAATTPRPGPPRPGPPRPDSKPKIAPPQPAPAPPPPAPPAAPEEEEQDSITATAPRVDASKLPVPVPKIALTPIEGEEDLETEVKTMTGAEGAALVTALTTAEPAQAPAPVPPPPEEDDDPATMTAQAPAPTGAVPETTASPLGDDEDDEDGATVNTAAPMAATPASSPAMRVRISSKSLMEPSTLTGTGDAPTKPGVDKHEAPTKSGVGGAPAAKEYEPEDSITSRALAKVDDADDYEEDSVTTQALAPAVGAAAGLIPPTGRSDDTDATTQKKSKPPASPADEEQESITTQAPGHLTNMLRVIASDTARRSSPDVPPAFEDDEPPENKTAVMPNAPVKGAPGGGPIMKHGTLQGMGPVSPPSTRPPAISPLGANISVAPRLDPGSESGLRVAHGDAASGEHASLGVILGAKERMSSRRVGVDSEARLAHANTEPVYPPLSAPDEREMPRTPRYGLLVTVVAAISIIIPVSLYVFLNRGDDAITPGVPAQPSADVVKRGDPLRQKYVKLAASSRGKHR